MSKTRTPAERTSAPPSGLPVREATAGCEPYNAPLPNANFNGPKENAVALALDGSVAWVEPSETFAMGYRVPDAVRCAGYIPTADELDWGRLASFLDRCPASGGWHPMNETTCEHCEGV